MDFRYGVRFVREGKWWVADIPGVGGGEGMATQGKTLQDARHMAVDAILGVLHSRLKHGEPLDPPQDDLPAGDGWEWVELPLRAQVALRIRQERKEAALTMQQAADRVGVPLGTYQRWEDPWRCNATLGTLQKVARALGRRIELQFV